MPEEARSRQESTQFDPYALDPSAIRQPPTTLGKALREMGPGLILAGSIVGTGELIQTTDLGGKVGFALLWLVIFSCFIKVFVQVELGRHTIASGLTTLEAFKLIPVVGTIFVWWWLIMTLITLSQLAAMVDGVSQAVVRGAELLPWIERGAIGEHLRVGCGGLIALVTIALLVTGTYAVVQNVTMLLVCLFTLFTTLCVALLPFTEASFSLGEILRGLVPKAPRFAWKEALSMFAITGVGASELLSYPYWCIEKGYARWTGPRTSNGGWLERARGWLRVMRLDAWGSMVVYTVATVAFYVLGAAVLFTLRSGQGLGEGKELLPTLIAMYTPVLGDLGAHLIVLVGAIAVLFSTLFVASAGHARMTADFLYVIGCFDKSDHRHRLFLIRLFCFAYPLAAFIIFVIARKPVLLVRIGGLAQAVTLPMIAVSALYFRYRRCDRNLRPSLLWDCFLLLSVVSLIAAGSIAAYRILSERPGTSGQDRPASHARVEPVFSLPADPAGFAGQKPGDPWVLNAPAQARTEQRAYEALPSKNAPRVGHLPDAGTLARTGACAAENCPRKEKLEWGGTTGHFLNPQQSRCRFSDGRATWSRIWRWPCPVPILMFRNGNLIQS